MDRWSQWIYADAPRFGIDPEAAWAISMNEWPGRGGVGDHGTSFGPFQLHAGGALPRGRGRKWAESRAGVDYALRQMAKSGARGLRGQRAVAAIAGRFERPSDVSKEIRVAMAHYGHGGGVVGQQAALAALAQHGGNPPPGPAPNLGLIGMLLGQINPAAGQLVAQYAASQPAPVAGNTQPRASARGAGAVGKAAGRINELFYDPLGGIKMNKPIGAIGGHNDHVHVSLSTAASQWRAIQQAKRMGLRVGQDLDSNVTNVHVHDSYHYRKYNNKSPLRMAADVSGDPRQMAAFYRWVAANH